MPLKNWQAWTNDYVSRKLVPVFVLFLSKKMAPNMISEPYLLQLWTTPLLPIIGY